MIQAKIIMDSGDSFFLGSDYGSRFTLDPLTELEAELQKSRRSGQAGVIVTGTSIGGVDRTLSGCFVTPEARSLARQLCRVLIPAATGTLYLGDAVCTEFYVEKSPELTFESHDCIEFACMLFSPDPWWLAAEAVTGETNVYIPQFQFPTTLDSHTFATLSEGGCSLRSSGNTDSRFSLQFTVRLACSRIGLINADTLEKLELEEEFTAGDLITVEWVGGILTILRNGSENLFHALTEDSDLFSIHPGGNLLRSYAAEGSSCVSARIKFRPASTAWIGV